MNKDQYFAQITPVLEFIEENIDEKLSLEQLAKLAGFSPYHFHRIFTAYVGETLSSFIRRVKLEKAAYKLKYKESNITEIALEAGYENPTAFNRAFKKYFGMSPTQFKSKNSKQYFIQRKPEYFEHLKELIMENFTGIKELEDINVVSVRKTGNYSESAAKAWSEICKFISTQKDFVSAETKFIGISYDDPSVTPEEKLRYEACVTVNKEIEVSGEIQKNTIKGGRYATFLHKGPYENFIHTYNAIFMQWLPESGEKLKDLPCFEHYINNPQEVKPEELRTEVYIPIQ